MIKRFFELFLIEGKSIRIEIEESFDLLTLYDLASAMIKSGDIKEFSIRIITYD